MAPVPRLSGLLPVKVKSPLHVPGLLAVRVSAPPEVLSMVVPPATAKVPAAVPSAVALLMFSVPADRVAPPLKAFAPERVSAPAPALMRPPVPPIAPPTVSAAPVVVTVRTAAPSATAPAPRLSALDPVKVKLPLQVWGLLAVTVRAPPEVLSMVVPPAMESVPAVAPSAVALLMPSAPADSVRPPLKVFAPARVSVPLPALVNAKAPLTTPLTARSFTVDVQVWFAPSATGQAMLLPATLAVMPPAPTVSVPVPAPTAAALPVKVMLWQVPPAAVTEGVSWNVPVPLPICTSWLAVGTTPRLQLDAVFQSMLVVPFQTSTPSLTVTVTALALADRFRM